MSNEKETPHAHVNWEYLVDSISEEKCVLVIGPELARNSGGPTLIEYIDLKCKADGIEPPTYTPEGFLDFKDENSHLIYYYIKKYYKEAPVPDIYHTIVQLPFHLIISLSPDNFLRRAYREAGKPVRYGYYNKSKQEMVGIPPPNGNEPLIYNLLGDANEMQSPVYTYLDLFKYVENIFGNHQLPEELRLLLKRASNYIFLGVKFEGWYLKLLFRILKIHESQRNYASLKSGIVQLDDHVKTFYPQYFKVNFVEEQVDAFVNKLKEFCAEKMTLSTAAPQVGLLQLVEAVIIKPDTGITDALQVLKTHIYDYQINFDTLIILEREYGELKAKILSGTVKDAEVKTNIIVEKILEIARNAHRR